MKFKICPFQHLGFVHCPIREHCPAFPHCTDAIVERTVSTKYFLENICNLCGVRWASACRGLPAGWWTAAAGTRTTSTSSCSARTCWPGSSAARWLVMDQSERVIRSRDPSTHRPLVRRSTASAPTRSSSTAGRCSASTSAPSPETSTCRRTTSKPWILILKVHINFYDYELTVFYWWCWYTECFNLFSV